MSADRSRPEAVALGGFSGPDPADEATTGPARSGVLAAPIVGRPVTPRSEMRPRER
jgi:hypothetical protein